MRALSYNVHGWRSLDGAPNVTQVASVIADSGADIVGLNEVFHPWPISGDSALSLLAGRLGMSCAFGPTQVSGVSHGQPLYGNAVLSRWPILAYAAHHLAPITACGQRGLLEARVLPPFGRPVTLYVTHLDHRSEDVRLVQWSSASAWLSRDRDRAHLLLGDFNALAATDYADQAAIDRLAAYQQAKGWPVPAFDLISRILSAGYADACAGSGGVCGATYPTGSPERRIDYVFLPRSHADAIRGCSRVESAEALLASDHLPVCVDLAWH